ncbi:MAG: class I SAM-dependent methyltransferase [Cyclobacteriaceae bacterium]|nr:class I SAM-dependent methyltransferase [Cyclobacteriaceae bacterium]
MYCQICNSKLIYYKWYDNHLFPKSANGIIKKLLPWFDFLIPDKFQILKKFSKANIFKGKVIVCKECGYGTMETPPTQEAIKKYYEYNYWQNFRERNVKPTTHGDVYDYLQDLRAGSQIFLVNSQFDLKNIMRTLEIGAGPAFASQLLRNRFKNISMYVCEPGTSWDRYYQMRGLHRIANFFPFDTNETFDYIHTSHWLEHVLDLRKTIYALYNVLNDGGCLFVEVPNTPEIYWELPIGDTPHIHFFTVQSLKAIFEEYHFSCHYIDIFGTRLGKTTQKPSYEQDSVTEGVWIRAIFHKPNQKHTR